MAQVKYVIGEAGISLATPNGIKTISSSDFAYGEIKYLIEAGKLDRVELIPLLDDEYASVFSFDDRGGFEINPTRSNSIPEIVSRKLLELIRRDLPVQPLVDFCTKVNSNSIMSQAARNAAYGLLNHYPLTWGGNLIAYKRASFTYVGELQYADYSPDLKKFFNSPFQSGATVKGEQLLLGSLDWVARSCPDQGAIYDVEVSPTCLMRVMDEQKIFVNSYTNISLIEETNVPATRQFEKDTVLELLKTQLNSVGDILVLRQPYNDRTIAQFVNCVASCDRVPQLVRG